MILDAELVHLEPAAANLIDRQGNRGAWLVERDALLTGLLVQLLC